MLSLRALPFRFRLRSVPAPVPDFPGPPLPVPGARSLLFL
jgi:hypothetical protein